MGCGSVFPFRVFAQEAPAEISHSLCIPAGLELGHGILTAVDTLLQRLRFIASRADAPCWILADREPAFPARPRPIIEDEGSRSGGSHSDAEAFHTVFAVVGDAVASGGRCGRHYCPFVQPACHRCLPSPHCVRTVNGNKTAYSFLSFPDLSIRQLVVSTTYLRTRAKAESFQGHAERAEIGLLIMGSRVRVPPGSPASS